MTPAALTRLRSRIKGLRCRVCNRPFVDAGLPPWNPTIVIETVVDRTTARQDSRQAIEDRSGVTDAERKEIEAIYAGILARVANESPELCRGCGKPKHDRPELVFATDEELRSLRSIYRRIVARKQVNVAG